MAYATKITASDGETYNFQDLISGYTTKTGTVTSVATGAGLTGGTITTSGTIKCDLKSETKSSLATASRGSTSSREYAVGRDSNNDLSVNIPWTDTKLTAGTNISISSNTISTTNIGDIGTETGYSGTNTNINHNTWTYVMPSTDVHQFSKGVYVIKAIIQWQTYNSSSGGTAAQTRQGYRFLLFSNTANNGSAINRFSCSTIKAYNSSTNQQILQELVFVWHNTTDNKKIYLNAWQNSGGPLYFQYTGYTWVRIA